MPDLTKAELLDLRISSIINSAEDAMFQKFDDLHQQNHSDDEVIRYLRKQGYTGYAESYIEWSGALDPDGEDNNTTLDPTVPDPASAASYDTMKHGEPRVAFAPAKVDVVWP